MRKTKIICTMGPSIDAPDMFAEMVKNGLDVARLNMSHCKKGDYTDAQRRIDMVRKVSKELKKHVGIMLDTKGPEIRLRTFEDGSIVLKEKDKFVLTIDQSVVGNQDRVAVSYLNLPKVLKAGDTVLINDGQVDLTVVSTTSTEVVTKVKYGGLISNNKAVNLPNVDLDMVFVSETDREDIEFGIKNGVHYVALSFVRMAQDVLDVRAILKKHKAEHIHLISKIESRQGVNNIDEIIKVSDGIMVARGDMGVEIPFIEVPSIQKNIILACNQAGKYVITATHMLESMTNAPRATRAEVSDVANAVLDGSDCTMLSGESAAGKYPIRAVSTMADIDVYTESKIDYRSLFNYSNFTLNTDNESVVASQSTVGCAMAMHAKAIVVPTDTGRSVREIARFRPNMPIIAICNSQEVAEQLAICWGTISVVGKKQITNDDTIKHALEMAKSTGLVSTGDTIVLPMNSLTGKSGWTNNIRIEKI
ncbi:MAG: pyruvate kinase [Firmicutes bacterium]|nr:pyruvate kinase [Bacillota bacterium]MCL1954058.1 pyruvate kinase [Bacillota bacterium]